MSWHLQIFSEICYQYSKTFGNNGLNYKILDNIGMVVKHLKDRPSDRHEGGLEEAFDRWKTKQLLKKKFFNQMYTLDYDKMTALYWLMEKWKSGRPGYHITDIYLLDLIYSITDQFWYIVHQISAWNGWVVAVIQKKHKGHQERK